MATTVIIGANTDGYVRSYHSTYSTARNGVGSTGSGTTDSYYEVGQRWTGTTYYCTEFFYEFDTSSIPDENTISSVVLTVTPSSGTPETQTSPIQARYYDWGGTLTNSDYVPGNSFADLPIMASLPTGTYNGGTHYDFTSSGAFTAATGMKTGYVRLVLCSESFANNVAPTDNTSEQIAFYTANAATEANRPRLTITHSLLPQGTGGMYATGSMESYSLYASLGSFSGTGSYDGTGQKRVFVTGSTGAINLPITLNATGSQFMVPSSYSGIDAQINIEMKKNGSSIRYDDANAISRIVEEQENKRCEVRLYAEDGKTFVAILDKARNVRWQDELNSIGSASFEVPLNDAKTSLIEPGMVAKFYWRGKERFGCIITKESVEICKDEQHNIWLTFEGQPGGAEIFKRAVVFPEWNISADGTRIENSTSRGVISKTRNTDRWFGFMSWRGEWLVPEDWSTPAGTKYNMVTDTVHSKWCFGWHKIDENAYWIDLSPGPEATRTAGEVHYFRGEFTLSTNVVANFWATADNMCTIYLDNELLFEEDRTSIVQWQTPKSKQVELLTGTHLIAVRVENAINLETVGPMALILSLVKVSESTGSPAENYISEEYACEDMFTSASSGIILTAMGLTNIRSFCRNIRGTSPSVTVEVYSSSIGDAGENLTLTQQRALAVRNAIVSILAERSVTPSVTYSGLGETNFKYSPDTESRNHRVIITYPPTVDGEGTSTPSSSKIVFRSNVTDNWHVTSTSPGWYRAQVIKKLIEEAWDRGVYGFETISSSVLMSFTDYRDSYSLPWANRGQFSFEIGSTTILDVLEELSADYLDWHWDAANWELDCYNRAGSDKTDRIRFFPGYSLSSFVTSSDSSENVTWLTTRLENGEWLSLPDYGETQPTKRIEKGLSIGSSDAQSTALQVMNSIIDDNEDPVISFEATTSTAIGYLPYIDYELGDTVLVPGHRGEGSVPARVLSITCDFSTEPPTWHPELVIDRASPSYEG